MFNMNLLDKEKIVLVDNDSLLKNNSDIINVTIIITNYRLLILDYPKGLNALKFGRMINYPQEKEVIFETELKNIVNINKVKEFYKYTLSDSNYFLLKSKIVQNYLKNL